MILTWTVEQYARVGSTNDLVKERARTGAGEGLVMVADEQHAGRGRRGRNWAAPPGSSLLMSLLLRPIWMPPRDAFLLTMLASVALCEAVETLTPLRAALKWPNDLLLPVQVAGNAVPALRKAAGILSEVEIEHGHVAWVVIGIGVNVSWTPMGVIDGRDLAAAATSVCAAAGEEITRAALQQALLTRLAERYTALRRGQREALFNAWRARLALLGQRIAVQRHSDTLHGYAEDVDPSGALLLCDDAGVRHTITAGDVVA